MELNYFKDKLFDLLNETDKIKIVDLNADDRNDLFTVKTDDGSVFEILCRQVTDQKK